MLVALAYTLLVIWAVGAATVAISYGHWLLRQPDCPKSAHEFAGIVTYVSVFWIILVLAVMLDTYIKNRKNDV